MKNLRLPADAPKRAAWIALIPGMGAVYNNEYLKAITYFAVWAGLALMGNKVNGIFGFGAFAFIIFTMFDAYRTAEANARRRVEGGAASPEPPRHDKVSIGWGVFLMVLGFLFLLQNIISYYFLNRLWPLVFIGIGCYLLYLALRQRKGRNGDSAGSVSANIDFGPREDI
jgi:4-hydroxybenzoate polyprenyltransferase